MLNPNREGALKGAGPVVLVVDNGWAAASRFNDRLGLVDRLIGEAEAQSRPVMLAQTAPPARTQTLRIEAPAAARSTAAALAAQPFAPRRREAAEQIGRALAGETDATILWLSGGIEHDAGRGHFAGFGGVAGTGVGPEPNEERKGHRGNNNELPDFFELGAGLLAVAEANDGIEHLKSGDIEGLEDLVFHWW